ncbi:MAG: alpha/beta hydrolase [Hymenobacteraceae bacterium]|nr:alpha/beta hydrolase [Hymenobacteraceae bacterium]MDX5482741.1 alpha/beta hydrolase [Hymenobacteraceae bacterium]
MRKAIGLVGLTLFLLLLSFLAWKVLVSPATTPIEGTASVASLEKVELGGLEQWVLMRGSDTTNPVLLWLHGGPGAAQMPVARYFNGVLEEEFVVVHWDQRGAGKSNSRHFDEKTMTFGRFLADAHELTQHLKKRFDKRKIFLLGHSWGSYLGIKLAQQYPEDYHAYLGVSQVVNSCKAGEVAYSWLLQQLEARQATHDLNKLQKLGKPPYPEHDQYVRFMGLVDDYGGGMDVGVTQLAFIALRAPEYRLADYPAWVEGAIRGSGPMWDETKTYDLAKEVPKVQVPVYFFMGENDYNTPVAVLREYYRTLEAPGGKRLVVFEHAAHTPFMAAPEKFNREVLRVKAATLPNAQSP